MSEHDFQAKVMDALRDLQVTQAETTNEVKNLVERMDKQNHSVVHLQEDSIKHSIELAERRLSCPLLVPVAAQLADHITNCPMKSRMDVVEDWITTAKATASANSHWLNRLWPVFYAAAGVAVYMLAMHADQLLKALSAK
jgi:hypothetical protein